MSQVFDYRFLFESLSFFLLSGIVFAFYLWKRRVVVLPLLHKHVTVEHYWSSTFFTLFAFNFWYSELYLFPIDYYRRMECVFSRDKFHASYHHGQCWRGTFITENRNKRNVCSYLYLISTMYHCYNSCPFIFVLSFFFLASKLPRSISSSYKRLDMASLEAILACNRNVALSIS